MTGDLLPMSGHNIARAESGEKFHGRLNRVGWGLRSVKIPSQISNTAPMSNIPKTANGINRMPGNRFRYHFMIEDPGLCHGRQP
jgi:hypothetical protein